MIARAILAFGLSALVIFALVDRSAFSTGGSMEDYSLAEAPPRSQDLQIVAEVPDEYSWSTSIASPLVTIDDSGDDRAFVVLWTTSCTESYDGEIISTVNLGDFTVGGEEISHNFIVDSADNTISTSSCTSSP